MRKRPSFPEINAGSTADIAFLLLVFFLVTTTFPNERGIVRKLPKDCTSGDCSFPVKERNILRIHLNKLGDYLLDDRTVAKDSLVFHIESFIDNNGNGACTYCSGAQDPLSSELPKKAILYIAMDSETPYGEYIFLQNEINRAYRELRETYALKYFKKPLSKLNALEWLEVKEAYPMQISEASMN